jgi:sugar lactone lactonase YvrE
MSESTRHNKVRIGMSDCCASLLRRIPTAYLAFLLLPLICFPVGCGRPAGKIFTPIDPEIAWPLPPEPPRIKCLGEIRSSEDLHSAKSGWQVLQERLHPEESRPIPLTKPHAIAVQGENRVYVVDTGLACLHVLDLEHRTHRRVDSAGGDRLRSPVGVAVGAAGVYVTDAMLGDVIEFNFDGEFQRRLGVELERPAGIAYCPTNNRLYVIDTAAHQCLILERSSEERSDWTIVARFGERGTEPGMFNFPTHVTWSPLLGLVVSDTLNFRVQRFDADGEFRAGMGQKGDGAGDFSLPKGVAVDRDGHIYVVDAHFENVQVFDQKGRLLLAFGSEGEELGQFAVPAGIAIDEADRIWVADSYNHRLQVFQYLGTP